jgi:hypothetical protein
MILGATKEWKSMCTSKRGAIGEYMAANWLLACGYEVFKNLTPSGAIDIIAWKDGEMHLIDVSVAKKNYLGKYSDCKKQAATKGASIGVKILYVLEDGECVWREDMFKPNPEIECVECRNLFTPRKSNELVCSDSCRKTRIPRINKAKYLAKKQGGSMTEFSNSEEEMQVVTSVKEENRHSDIPKIEQDAVARFNGC